MKEALVAALLFILAAFAIEQVQAQPTISLGTAHTKSTVTYGEVGYEYKGWEANYGQLGKGKTDYGYQEVVDIYSLSRLIRPGWCLSDICYYMRIGVAKVDESPLVGPTNYRLGLGLENDYVALEAAHFSSANIHPNNGGIDIVQLRLKLPLGD